MPAIHGKRGAQGETDVDARLDGEVNVPADRARVSGLANNGVLGHPGVCTDDHVADEAVGGLVTELSPIGVHPLL